MIQNEKLRIGVNRVMSFLIGGLLVLVIMNMTVVSTIKAQNAQLTKNYNEAGQMLSDAKAQVASRNYQSAQTTLDALFEKHPGSAEVVEGRKLYTDVAATVAKDSARWDTAVGAIKDKWARDLAARLRSQSEAQRQEMEKDMTDTIAKEWEKAKDQVRQEWARQQG
jgi:hypothetical protein